MVGDRADAMLEVMDEGMDEARHEGRYRRIEVITGRRQRRNWTDEEKARILAESAEPDVNISAIARRWGVNRGLLNGVDPEAWLADVLERIIAGKVKASEMESLLPWNWKAEREALTEQERRAA